MQHTTTVMPHCANNVPIDKNGNSNRSVTIHGSTLQGYRQWATVIYKLLKCTVVKNTLKLYCYNNSGNKTCRSSEQIIHWC